MMKRNNVVDKVGAMVAGLSEAGLVVAYSNLLNISPNHFLIVLNDNEDNNDVVFRFITRMAEVIDEDYSYREGYEKDPYDYYDFVVDTSDCGKMVYRVATPYAQ